VRQRLPGRAPLPQPQLAHAHPLAGPPAFKRYEDGLLVAVRGGSQPGLAVVAPHGGIPWTDEPNGHGVGAT
jgi:hypothetical protein